MVTLQTVLKNFRWFQWGAERRVERAQTWERGPPSAPVEILCIPINTDNSFSIFR